MAYEEMKRWGFEQKRMHFEKKGRKMTPKDDKLVSPSVLNTGRKEPQYHPQSNTSYTIMSATAKLSALTSTYPYQVVRSRIQASAVSALPITTLTQLDRTTRRRTYTPPYLLLSNGPGRKKASKGFTEGWAPTWSVFFQGLA
jgi:solute carrier family 25 (mitochondrial folate transporter), member 32